MFRLSAGGQSGPSHNKLWSGGVNRPRISSSRKLGVTLGVVQLIVTGANGKLGKLLRAVWSAAPPDGLSLHWVGRQSNAEIQWDLLAGPPPTLPKGAVILHLAGTTSGSEVDLRRNSAMIGPLISAAHSAVAQRIIFASTAAVYGHCDKPVLETDKALPLSPYGAAKLAAEELLLGQSHVPASILRIGNVVGADALMGLHNAEREIILDPVEGRSGGPIRSWIGPRQLAGLLAKLVLMPLPQVLNIAADPPIAMADLLNAAGRPWRYGPHRPGVLDYAVLDTTRLQGLVPMQSVTPTMLAQDAAWAAGILA